MIYEVSIVRTVAADMYVEADSREQADEFLERLSVDLDLDCCFGEVETEMRIVDEHKNAEDILLRPIPRIIKAKELLNDQV